MSALISSPHDPLQRGGEREIVVEVEKQSLRERGREAQFEVEKQSLRES